MHQSARHGLPPAACGRQIDGPVGGRRLRGDRRDEPRGRPDRPSSRSRSQSPEGGRDSTGTPISASRISSGRAVATRLPSRRSRTALSAAPPSRKSSWPDTVASSPMLPFDASAVKSLALARPRIRRSRFVLSGRTRICMTRSTGRTRPACSRSRWRPAPERRGRVAPQRPRGRHTSAAKDERRQPATAVEHAGGGAVQDLPARSRARSRFFSRADASMPSRSPESARSNAVAASAIPLQLEIQVAEVFVDDGHLRQLAGRAFERRRARCRTRPSGSTPSRGCPGTRGCPRRWRARA